MGEIDLFIIGKTGNGKSALGNTILRRKAFESKSWTTSVTTKIQYEVSEFNNRVIKVVDGPGVGDTRMDTEEATEQFMNAMASAISVNPEGYHAFLLVLKFGGRLTTEDQDTITFLKKIFGDKFVRDFCILVVTWGDTFEQESVESGTSFQDWCKEQVGFFEDIFRECSKRVLLFDNKTKDKNKIVTQINNIIQMVDEIGQRYKNNHFEKAKTTRDRLMIEAKKPIIRDETMKETSLIIQQIQRIQASCVHEENIEILEKLGIRTEILYNGIQTQDNGTGALHDLVETISSLKKTIDDEMRIAIRITQESKEMKLQMAEMKRALEEEKSNLIKENHKILEKEQQLREREKRKRLESETRFDKERLENQKKMEDLERKFQELKLKNEEGYFEKLVNFVKRLGDTSAAESIEKLHLNQEEVGVVGHV